MSKDKDKTAKKKLEKILKKNVYTKRARRSLIFELFVHCGKLVAKPVLLPKDGPREGLLWP